MAKWKTRLSSHPTTAFTSLIFFTSSEEFSKETLFLLFSFLWPLYRYQMNSTTQNTDIPFFDAKVNHPFYTDDLKLFARNDNELEGLLATAKEFSNDIGMIFGLEKCAKVSFLKGLIQKTTDMKTDINTTIRELEPGETYKYLGFNEGNGINHSAMKEKIRKEYYRLVRLILKTEVNSKKSNYSNKHTSHFCCAIQL